VGAGAASRALTAVRDRRAVLALSLACGFLLIAAPVALFISGLGLGAGSGGGNSDDGVYTGGPGQEGNGGVPTLTTGASRTAAPGDAGLHPAGDTDAGSVAGAGDGSGGPAGGGHGTGGPAGGGTSGTGGGTAAGSDGGGGGSSHGGQPGSGGTGGDPGDGGDGGGQPAGQTTRPPADPTEPPPDDGCVCEVIPDPPAVPTVTLPNLPLPTTPLGGLADTGTGSGGLLGG
jgi:hypothetical protein